MVFVLSMIWTFFSDLISYHSVLSTVFHTILLLIDPKTHQACFCFKDFALQELSPAHSSLRSILLTSVSFHIHVTLWEEVFSGHPCKMANLPPTTTLPQHFSSPTFLISTLYLTSSDIAYLDFCLFMLSSSYTAKDNFKRARILCILFVLYP